MPSAIGDNSPYCPISTLSGRGRPNADIGPCVTLPSPLGGQLHDFRLPKPLHCWREFAGEVAIIVMGVLIALGAEQVVISFNDRS